MRGRREGVIVERSIRRPPQSGGGGGGGLRHGVPSSLKPVMENNTSQFTAHKTRSTLTLHGEITSKENAF